MAEDKQYRQTPEDGHCLLLMETQAHQKTFTDCTNLVSCLDGMLNMYEQTRISNGLDKDNYDIDKVWNWIDEFHRMDLFVFDRELGRYKKSTRNEIKQHFITQISRC